jgi:hypothetical protein
MFFKYLYTFQRRPASGCRGASADHGRENRFIPGYSCSSPEKFQNVNNFVPDTIKIKNYCVFSDYCNKKILNTTCSYYIISL